MEISEFDLDDIRTHLRQEQCIEDDILRQGWEAFLISCNCKEKDA